MGIEILEPINANVFLLKTKHLLPKDDKCLEKEVQFITFFSAQTVATARNDDKYLFYI